MHLHFQNEIQNKQYQLVVRLGPSCPIDLENNSQSRNPETILYPIRPYPIFHGIFFFHRKLFMFSY